jgi:hypothetical protein
VLFNVICAQPLIERAPSTALLKRTLTMFFMLCLLDVLLQLWISISRLRETEFERRRSFGVAHLLLGTAWLLLFIDADNSPVKPAYILYVLAIGLSIAHWYYGYRFLRGQNGDG